MRKIPMTITVHTNAIPFANYGDMSLLGEQMVTPIMRCRFCDVQPEFMYHNKNNEYEILHICKADSDTHRYTERSYEGLAKLWNEERGKVYEKERTRK